MGLLGAATTAKGGGIVGGLWNAYKNSKITKEQPFVNPYADVTIGKAQQSAYNMIAEAEGAKAAREALNDLQDKQIEVLEYMRQNDTGMTQAITALGEAAQNSSGLLDVFKAKGVGAIKAVGMAAANFAIAAVISAAVSAAIKLIDEWVNHTKHLNEASKEYGSQIKSISKDIDSFKEQIAKQKSIIDDNKSSIEDVTKARSELYDLQQQMVETYGNEAGAINTITEAINGNTDALGRNIDKLKEIQYQNIVEDFNKEHGGIFYQMTAPLKQQTINSDGTIQLTTMTPFEEAMHDMEHSKVNMSNLVNVSTPELKKYYEDFARNHGWDDSSNIEDHVDILMEFFDGYLNALDNMKQSTDSIMTEGQYNVMKESVSKLRQPIRETSEQNRDIYNQTMLHNMRTGMYKETYDLLNDLYTKYTNAKDEEVQQQVLDAYSKAIDQIKSDGSMEHGMQEAFINLYPVLQAEASKWSFKVKFEADKDHLRTSIAAALGALTRQNNGTAYTTEELINWNPQLHTTDQNNAYNNLSNIIGPDFTGGINQAASAGLIDTPQIKALKDQIKQLNDQSLVGVDETLLTAIKDVDDLQKKFTYAWGKIGKDVPNGAQKVNTALKLIAREEEKSAKSLKELDGMDLSDVAKHLTKLNDVYDKLKKDGEVKWNTIDTKDFKESFGDIKDETGEFQKAFDDFHKVLSSTPNDTKAVQEAFDTLASSYVYNSDCMSLLNENNKDLVIGMLSDNGVLNATEVVNDALARKAEAAQYDAFSENLLAQQGVDLTNVSGESATATLEGAVAFLEQAGYAEQDQAAIAKLILEQWALNGSQIDTSGSCSALQDLAAMAGVAAGQIIALNNAMAGGTGGVPAGMSADEWDQVYDKEAYFKHEQERRQQETLEQLRGARERVRLGGGGGGSSSGGGGGGGGGNKEPSKTDKEFDYVNRALQIMQEQNDELREKVDNQYVILQDAEGNAEEFSEAIGRLGEAEQELNSLGVYYGEDEFTEFLKTLDLSDTAETLNENVGEIEDAYKEVSDIYDDTSGLVHPVGYQDGDTFLGAEIEDYDKVITAAKKYKKALSDVEKAKDKTSKTLDENGTGQLTFIKQLQESDKQLIAAYEHAADSYKTEWEDYKAKILEAFKEDGKGEKYIQDIMFGNLDPEEWERMITYDSNDQTMKDNVELLERAQTAYDHNKESLKSMREWQQKLNDDVQKEYEMRLNIVKAEMTEIESRMNEAQHDLDMKEILGEVVQEADYQRLINISEEQVANYEKQLDVLNEQLGTLDEGEQAWYDCKSQIADCEQNIRECVKQQAEWNDTILRMPVENISRFLGLIKNLGQTLKNWLSVNDAKGIAQNAEQIQTSWTTAYDQIADDELGLMKQLEDYEELLENYDLGSTKFSEVDDEIQSARDSVEQLVEEMIELNKQLLTIPIDKLSEMTTYLDGTLSDLQSIQSEYETTINTVIDLITEQQDNLEEEYNELEKSIEDQISPLEKQLEELQKANDARDRQLQIEQALLALETAREQKTVQVNYGLNLQ